MKQRNHPKKKRRPEIGRPVEPDKMDLVTIVLFLITRIPIGTTDSSATSGSDRGSFESSTGLGSNDSADEGTAESTGGRAALSVWSGRSPTVGEGKACENTDDGCKCKFHGIVRWLNHERVHSSEVEGSVLPRIAEGIKKSSDFSIGTENRQFFRHSQRRVSGNIAPPSLPEWLPCVQT